MLLLLLLLHCYSICHIHTYIQLCGEHTHHITKHVMQLSSHLAHTRRYDSIMISSQTLRHSFTRRAACCLLPVLFCSLPGSAMLWITFAPVSDDANDYFDGNRYDCIILRALCIDMLTGEPIRHTPTLSASCSCIMLNASRALLVSATACICHCYHAVLTPPPASPTSSS